MFTVTQVAERYQVSRDTVLSWIGEGALGALNVSPSRSKRRFYRIAQEDLEEFERSRRVGAKTTRKPSPFTEKRQYV